MQVGNIKKISLGLASTLFAFGCTMFSGAALSMNGGGGGGNGSCDELAPGTVDCTIDGREYQLYVPNSYDSGSPSALVVDLHGLTQSNTSQRAISGWNRVANQEGFVVAYPQGEGRSWNAHGYCCGSSSVDDVGFIRDMVASIQSAGTINEDMIYATGLSNGGAMTHTLACEAADVFDGAAAVAFGISGGLSFNGVVRNCNPAEPLPVIYFHGTNDSVVNYNSAYPGTLGAEDSLEAWREIQSCGSSSSMQQISSSTTCQTYSNCDGGVQVSMCTVEGGGHVLYPAVGGEGVAGTSWEFFQSGF